MIIDLADIRLAAHGAAVGAQDERKRVSYKDTATVLGIMRIQKTRMQNRTDALLVEFLDAVALELANV